MRSGKIFGLAVLVSLSGSLLWGSDVSEKPEEESIAYYEEIVLESGIEGEVELFEDKWVWDMPVIKGEEGVEYHILVQEPDESREYALIVKEVGAVPDGMNVEKLP